MMLIALTPLLKSVNFGSDRHKKNALKFKIR